MSKLTIAKGNKVDKLINQYEEAIVNVSEEEKEKYEKEYYAIVFNRLQKLNADLDETSEILKKEKTISSI